MFTEDKLYINYKIKNILKVKTLKKTKQTVMFLRSPKHFKRGKQFLSKYTSYIFKSIELVGVNTSNIPFLPHKYLYNLLLYLYLKANLPEQNLKKVSLKFNLIVRF